VIADCDKALQLSPADWMLRPDVEKMKAMVQRQ
jgi:hypothetical protein